MSTGSETPPSHRAADLSQEDGGSGQSSVDISTAVIDDKERLSLLQSTVQWIKEELAVLRDKDRQILQQLLKAHSTVCDIREQQKQAVTIHQSLQNRKSVDYLSTLEKLKENESSDKGGASEKSTTMRTKISYSVSPPPHSPTTQKAESSDDDVLRRFLGEDTVGKFSSCLSQISTKDDVDYDKLSPKEPTPPVKKSMAELKAEAKRDGRSSVAFEMQMLRHKLQAEAREELAAFDKEFDSPTLISMLKEEDEEPKYRHSILNRMDEILNPTPQQYNRDAGHHVRQSSEPVMMHENVNSVQSHHSEDGPPGIARQSRLNSHQFVSHSFRLPSQNRFDFSRTGSESEKHTTHYNTSVVKRRRARPDSGSSVDSNGRYPLQYSVESLTTSEQDLAVNGVAGNQFADYDLDRPEMKAVSPTSTDSSPKHKSHSRSQSLQLSTFGVKPMTKFVPQLSEDVLHSGPDIYPETSVSLANSKPFSEGKRSFFGRSNSKKSKHNN